MQGNWDEARRLVEHSSVIRSDLARVCDPEVERVRYEVENRQMVTEMRAALDTGCVKGVTGQLDLTQVSVDALKAAVSSVSRLHPRTVAAKQLLATCQLLARLRGHVMRDAWSEVDVAVREHRGANLAPEGREEFNTIREEVGNRLLLSALHDALTTGHPTGAVGSLDLSSIDTRGLDVGIAMASKLGVRTEEASHALVTAQVVRAVRAAMRRGDKDGVVAALVQADSVSRAGKLSPLAEAELTTARQEMDNLTVRAALLTALSSGGPAGSPGNLDTVVVSDEGLARAIELTDTVGYHTAEVGLLYTSAQVVLRVRRALGAGDWKQATKLVAPAALDLSQVSRVCHAELTLVQDECDNRSAVRNLRRCMSSGGCSSNIAQLLSRSVETNDLDAAIQGAHALRTSTEAVRRYLWSAELVRMLRGAAREGDWEAIESCAGRAFSPTTGDPVSDLVREALPELTAARHAITNRDAVTALRAALSTGHASGPVGQLVVSTVELGPLRAAIDTAAAVPASTPASEALVRVAETVHELRGLLASRGDRWGDVERVLERAWATLEEARVQSARGVGARGARGGAGGVGGVGAGVGSLVPPAVETELTAVRDEVNNTRVVAKLQTALATGAAAGGPGSLDLDTVDLAALDAAVDLAQQLGCKTTLGANLLRSAEVLRAVRSSMLAGDWAAVGVALQQARELGPRMAESCSAELERVQDELDDRRIVGQLSEALRSGMATGEVGELDMSTVDVKGLSAAITKCAEIGCKSSHAQQLMATAQFVRRLRTALSAGDFFGLEQVLWDIKERTTVPLVRDELRVAQEELNNHTIISELEAALSRGMAMGQVGHQSYFTIVLTRLEEAIATSRRLGCRTEQAHQLLNVASTVLRLRRAQKADDWEAVAATLQEVRGLDIPPVCEAEISAARDEVDNRTVVAEIMAALVHGAPSGDVGAFDASTVVVSVLRGACQRAGQLACSTDEVEGLVAVGEAVIRVREALLEDDWDTVRRALGSGTRGPAWRVVQAEVDLVQGELDNRTLIARISKALSSGAASGDVGMLDLSSIEVAPLAVAVADALEASAVTEEAQQLLSTAQLVLTLRRALASEDWQGVERTLATAEKKPVARLARPELQMAQDALNDRIVVTRLISALTSCSAVGVGGHLDVSTVSVSQLDEAISVAVDLGCGTPRARRLLGSARIVRDLRAALMIGDWVRVHRDLAEVTLDGVSEECRVEIRVLQTEAANVTLTSMLMDALSRGRATGVTGHMEIKDLDLVALDQAISRGAEVNPKSAKVQELHDTAKLIRRLRDRFAPGGFLHYGQGKWYPGETLPRWTFSLYWRADGKPVWADETLVAREDQDTGVTTDQSQQFLQTMAEKLGVESDFVAPAFEDPAEWIVKEGNLPENVTPENSKLKDPE